MFDLYDFGTEVAEHRRGERSGEECRHVYDLDPLERLPSVQTTPSCPEIPQHYALIFAHAPFHRKVLTGPRAPCYVGDALCVLRGKGWRWADSIPSFRAGRLFCRDRALSGRTGGSRTDLSRP